MADGVAADSKESAIDGATIQTVIQALDEGRDVSEVLAETEAGLTGALGQTMASVLKIYLELYWLLNLKA